MAHYFPYLAFPPLLIRAPPPQVLAWKEGGGDAAASLWASLASANAAGEDAVQAVRDLSRTLSFGEYTAGVAAAAVTRSSEVCVPVCRPYMLCLSCVYCSSTHT